MDRRTITAILLVAGILDGIYLTVVHFIPGALKCPTIGTVVDCHAVLTSAFSNVFGIPLAILGLLWFVAGMLLLLKNKSVIIRNIWFIVGLGGVIYSFTAQTILGQVCIYCLLLDALIISSIISFLYMKRHK